MTGGPSGKSEERNLLTREEIEHNLESIEMLRDMEGEIYSTVQANVDKNAFEPMTIEELGEKLRDMTHVIPYGII